MAVQSSSTHTEAVQSCTDTAHRKLIVFLLFLSLLYFSCNDEYEAAKKIGRTLPARPGPEEQRPRAQSGARNDVAVFLREKQPPLNTVISSVIHQTSPPLSFTFLRCLCARDSEATNNTIILARGQRSAASPSCKETTGRGEAQVIHSILRVQSPKIFHPIAPPLWELLEERLAVSHAIFCFGTLHELGIVRASRCGYSDGSVKTTHVSRIVEAP